MTLTFDNPSGAIWLAAAAAVAALGIGAALWRRRAAARFADPALLPRIAPGLSLMRGIVRASLLGGAALCLAVALMDPRAAEQSEELTRRGADVMFVVDVSRSMLAEDATPNRLERAKSFISDAIDTLGGDRAGLIDFAGVAAVRAPLTLNYDALKAAVDGLEPKDSRRGGTMLGDAIRLATDSFTTDDAGHAIVILSDGEDMGSDPIAAAREAADRGVRIITVGIGDPREGARIPVGEGPGRRFLVHDGQEVWSRMDAATLRDIASATGGLFVPAATAQVELGEILSRSLGDLERTEGDATVARTTAPLFQWPAAIALALLVLESVAAGRTRRTAASVAPAHHAATGTDASAAAPAPRRRRRANAAVALSRASVAAVAGAACLLAAPSEALADGAPPRAKPRTVGRGQIDRAAFRDAVTRANAAMQAGQYSDAAVAFAEAMAADPTNAGAAYNRGVAEYRAGKLDDAAASFAEAAAQGDAALAADAMFNQGNATYQSALRALQGGAGGAGGTGGAGGAGGQDPAAAPPAGPGAPPAPGAPDAPAAEPDLAAATDAVSRALTHYKDAIAANPSDVDSRTNAELAHTLLKQLRELQQQQQQNQQSGDQQQDQQQQGEQQQGQQGDPKQQDSTQTQDQGKGQAQDGQPSEGQKGSDGSEPGQQDPDQQPSDGKGSESDSKDQPDPREPDSPKEPSEGADGQQQQQQPDPSDGGDPKTKPDGAEGDDKAQKPQGEVKAQSGAEQPTSEKAPPAPAQARAGELVPDAPLSKSEAERLLQGVRDRAKQRMEAKERAERVRQIPAVRDW